MSDKAYQALDFVTTVAEFTREGEDHNGEPYEYVYEDACEVINRLIDWAREIVEET